MSNKEVTAELLAIFNYYDGYRKQWEATALDCYQLYIGWKQQKPEGKSNLHIPKAYEVLDTIRSRLVKSFFGARPYLDFTPIPSIGGNLQNLQMDEQKAKVAAALVDMQLERNCIPAKWYTFVTDMLIYPCAIMGVGWRYELAQVRHRVSEPEIAYDPMLGYYQTGQTIDRMVDSIEVVWDDNELVNIDFFDFWPDPKGIDLDTCRGVFHREFVTRERLEKRLWHLQQTGEGTLYPVDLDRLQHTQQEEGRWMRLNAVGYSVSDPDVYRYRNDSNAKNVQYELLHYWEDDRHAILVNRAECVFDGPNPYWRHRKKPFVVESYEPLGREFYGLSATKIIADLQHEKNARHNQVMDNVNLLINRMWAKRRGADIDDSQLISCPNGIVEVDTMDDIKPLEMGDIKGSAFASMQIDDANIENALGTPPLVRGAAGGERTATEAVAKNTNASTRFDVKILLLECLGVKRLAMLMDMNNQQFVDQQRLIKITDGDASQWRIIEPDEICGEFDYSPAGTAVDPAANKEVRREQLTNMIQFLIQTQNPYIDLFALTKAWIESFDVRNPQKFLLSPEMVQQQQMMQQLMMMQGGALPGMPGGIGAPGAQMPNMAQIALSNQMGVSQRAG